MKPTDFAVQLTRFLSEHLSGQRNLSPNTILSYRDTFTLLISYIQSEHGTRPEKITLHSINPAIINGFLHWLENERKSAIATRNQRLAAIHSFFQYVQTERPDMLLDCQMILAIKMKKKPKKIVEHISENELKKILASPNTLTSKGRRDLTLMCVLYDTGARVQELADLKVGDVRLDNQPIVCLKGKGGKLRHVPILKQTTSLLESYLKEHNFVATNTHSHPLFYNSQGSKLTRSGVAYILRKYTQASLGSPHSNITPHVFRHTKAMHLLQSNVNLIHIRDFLGHTDITTTEVYARADAEMKRKAFADIEKNPVPTGLPAWHKDDGLMGWLKNLGK